MRRRLITAEDQAAIEQEVEDRQTRQVPTQRQVRNARRQVASNMESPQGFVRRQTTAYEQTDYQQEPIDIPLLEGPLARISLKAGTTLRIPGTEFEFIRVDVGLELPCQPVIEDIERAYEFGSRMIEDLINREVDAYIGEVAENGQE